VVSFTLTPLYARGKIPPYSVDRKLGGPKSRSGSCGKNPFAPAGKRTPIPRLSRPYPCRYTEWAIPHQTNTNQNKARSTSISATSPLPPTIVNLIKIHFRIYVWETDRCTDTTSPLCIRVEHLVQFKKSLQLRCCTEIHHNCRSLLVHWLLTGVALTTRSAQNDHSLSRGSRKLGTCVYTDVVMKFLHHSLIQNNSNTSEF
jgi:hypothetical protein